MLVEMEGSRGNWKEERWRPGGGDEEGRPTLGDVE
jgi:hypothetical protein